jgi:hypothetical protein
MIILNVEREDGRGVRRYCSSRSLMESDLRVLLDFDLRSLFSNSIATQPFLGRWMSNKHACSVTGGPKGLSERPIGPVQRPLDANEQCITNYRICHPR